MKKKINRMTIGDHLIEYQLQMIGKTVEEALEYPQWYDNWTMTPEQHAEFKAYAIPLLKKVFKFNTTKANSTFSYFNLQFGIKIL
jgi:hypothetical protein